MTSRSFWLADAACIANESVNIAFDLPAHGVAGSFFNSAGQLTITVSGSPAFPGPGHGAGSFFNRAGQLTITFSGWPACGGVARTRKRWPSGAVS